MHVKKSLMLWVAVFALAIPLLLVGTADAVRFNPDGAVQNPATGVWELPDASAGCFDGTDTIDTSFTNRPDCLNAQSTTLTAITTKSACQTYVQITSPAGVDLKSGTATWKACSKSLLADQTTCEGAGGTWSAFSKCSKYLNAADCTLAGGTYASSKCQSTSMSATICAAGGTIAGTATSWMGSYTAVANGLPATGAICDIYVGDATSCANAAYAGTMSSTNTDETRGQCSDAWVLKQVAGDGATATSAGTSGSLTSVENRACLRCHNETYQGTGSPFAEPASYIKGSHKNASRKVTAGKNWAGIKATTPESFGVIDTYKTRAINWSTGKIETTAGSGVYTDMYWFWGYYFEDITNGSDLAENGVKSTGVPTQNFRACTFCHGTGFVANNTLDSTKEPVKSFSNGIVWDGTALTPGTYPGVVNFRTPFGRSDVDDSSNVPSTNDCTALGGTISGSGSTKKCIIPAANTTENACVLGGNTIPGTPDWAGAWAGSWSATAGCTVTVNYKYAQWDEFGVECSNCHNSVDGGHNNSATGTRKNVPRSTVAQPAYGAQINDVCLQCHGKAGSSNAQRTAMDTELFADPTHVGSGHPNYHGSQFMNSPHSRFTGTYGQIADTTKYNSAFTANGGCEACHNPHGSVRENLLDAAVMGANKAEEGLKVTCASCHTGKTISHVTGTDTPMGAAGAPTDGCVICHMPGGQHLFRISADNVTPKNDSTGYNAAWITATAACQQCHAAGKVAASMPFTAAQAAAAAAGMHAAAPNPANTVCLVCHNSAQGTKRAVNSGVDHHNGTCTTCHPAAGGHFQSAWVTAGVAAPSIDATTATLQNRELPNFYYWSINTSLSTACLGCHAPGKMAATNIVPSGTGDNHHKGHTSVPGTSFGGVAEIVPGSSTEAGSRGANDPGMGCLGCHGKAAIVSGSASTGYVLKFAASGLSTSTVAAANGRTNTSGLCMGCHEVVQSGATQDHHVGACTSCHNPDGSNTNGTYGAGVATLPAGGINCTTLCHGGTSAVVINHPSGADAVLGATATERCEKCHASSGVISSVTYTNYVGVKPTSIDVACGQCHGGSAGAGAVTNGAPYKALADLTSYVPNIHGMNAIGAFTVSFGTQTSYVVNFDASGSSNASTYAWTFGDGAVATGVTASHTYAGSTPVTVTLTLNGSVSVSKTVTPVFVNHAPMVGGLISTYSANTLVPSTVNSYTVTFDDTSSDTDSGDVLTISVNWGDGSALSTGSALGTFSHTYVRAGKYAITHYAKDSHNASKAERAYVKIVPPVYTVTGYVKNSAGAVLPTATVYLKIGGHTRKIIRTDAYGLYTLPGVVQGTYTITAMKNGYVANTSSSFSVPTVVSVPDITLAPKQ